MDQLLETGYLIQVNSAIGFLGIAIGLAGQQDISFGFAEPVRPFPRGYL
jgi:hypothetical protein